MRTYAAGPLRRSPRRSYIERAKDMGLDVIPLQCVGGVGPLNEITNFVFGGFGVGLHPIAGHCFEECQFLKQGKCEANSLPKPKMSMSVSKFDIWLTRMSLIGHFLTSSSRATDCVTLELHIQGDSLSKNLEVLKAKAV